MSTISAAQLEANQANAQKSTGPKTPEGKVMASYNGRTHGMTGQFFIQPWENVLDFRELADAFLAEYQPASQTERELVDSLAQHRWLILRAMILQNTCVSGQGMLYDKMNQDFSLFLRYQATHERAFYKALSALQKLRAEKEKQREQAVSTEEKRANGFASQQHFAAAEIRKQEIHELTKQLKQAVILRHTGRTNTEMRPAAAA